THEHEHDAHTHSEHEHHHGHDDHDHANCEHDHDHSDHGHSHLDVDGFTSVSIARDQPLAIRKFQKFLDNQLPENVFRAKGILWFDESEKRHVFHLSGKRFSLEDEEWNGRPRKTQLVLIGQNLDHDVLKAEIENCFCIDSKNLAKGFSS
ncbi:MAG: GTP-binding protein, partial [Cyanobacteria bacterium P01_D01_bin.56]